MTNPLEWKTSMQIVALATLLGAIAGIITEGQALADSIPYATKAYVVAQLEAQTQLRNFDRRDQLDYQVQQQKATVLNLQALPPSPEKQDLVDTLKTDIVKKQKERDLLDCQIRFVVTGQTCTQSP